MLFICDTIAVTRMNVNVSCLQLTGFIFDKCDVLKHSEDQDFWKLWLLSRKTSKQQKEAVDSTKLQRWAQFC